MILFIFLISIQNGLLLYTNINYLKMRWLCLFKKKKFMGYLHSNDISDFIIYQNNNSRNGDIFA